MPLIVRGPGIRGGRTTRELAVNVDLAATVLDVTGAKPSRSVDGRSLIPYARKPSRPARDLPPGRRGPRRRSAAAAVPSYRAIRTTRCLWVEYSDGSRELYDRARDPYQLRSRHADRRYARTRATLARELKRLAACKGKSCRRSTKRIPPPRR